MSYKLLIFYHYIGIEKIINDRQYSNEYHEYVCVHHDSHYGDPDAHVYDD